MKHFRKLREGIDVAPFIDELAAFTEGWDTLRGEMIPMQRETLDIPLRKASFGEGVSAVDVQRSSRTEHYKKFPKLTALLESLQDDLGAELSRAMIVSLRPRGRVYRHRDEGEYYRVRDRYHLVLQSDGSRMLIEDEEVIFKEGELWWYDNKGLHESYNDSDLERIHVIFDMRPLSKWERMKRAVFRKS